MSTGYEGDEETQEETRIPPPEERNWRVETEKVARGQGDSETIYARIDIDDETIGMIRVPNNEYLRYIREAFLEKGEKE